jgi:hypothetical protein
MTLQDLMMEQWSNASATGYMVYAVAHYNRRVKCMNEAGDNYKKYRILTEDEAGFLIGCIDAAFDMKTVEEASELCQKWYNGQYDVTSQTFT